MDSEAKRIKEENKKLPLKKRMSNFWYYYRVHTIVAVICIILAGITVAEFINQPDYDMSVSIYMTISVEEDRLAEFSDFLQKQCVDIHGDDEINVQINPTFVDITKQMADEMTMSAYVKLQAGLTANEFAGYIVDESYKDYMVNSLDYPSEDVVEITDVPEVKSALCFIEGQKLYWMSGFDRGLKEGELTQFDNGKRIEDYFKKEQSVFDARFASKP